MEEPRQDLRTEFRAAAESSEEGRKMEEGGWKTEEMATSLPTLHSSVLSTAGLLSFAAAESQLISQSANRRLMRCSLSGMTWPMAPRNTRSSATASRPTRTRLAALSPLAE